MIRRPQTHTLPSVLDRLLDDEPDEPQRGVVLFFDIPDFKAALARDLEALLNTRVVAFADFAERFPLAAKTVVRFGIPDLSSLTLLSPYDRERLRGEVQYAIECFESRLTDVKVTLNMPEKPTSFMERMLHFRVDGTLKVHPHRPPVAFDATLQLSSNAYQVREKS
jgi:type VI secretion system protein ImpF